MAVITIAYSFHAKTYNPGEIAIPDKTSVMGEASSSGYALPDVNIETMLTKEKMPYTIKHTVSLVGKGYQVEQVVIENPSRAWKVNMKSLEKLID